MTMIKRRRQKEEKKKAIRELMYKKGNNVEEGKIAWSAKFAQTLAKSKIKTEEALEKRNKNEKKQDWSQYKAIASRLDPTQIRGVVIDEPGEDGNMPSFKKRRRWTDNHHVFENNTVDSSGLSMSVADQGFYVVVISHQAEHRCMWPTTCAISITGLGLILSLWLAQIIMPHQATLSCGPTCMGHGGQGLLSRFLEKNQVQREVPRAFSG